MGAKRLLNGDACCDDGIAWRNGRSSLPIQIIEEATHIFPMRHEAIFNPAIAARGELRTLA